MVEHFHIQTSIIDLRAVGKDRLYGCLPEGEYLRVLGYLGEKGIGHTIRGKGYPSGIIIAVSENHVKKDSL